MQKKDLRRNTVAGHSKIKKWATEKNGVIKHFKKEGKIENANKNMFEVSFLNWGIIKYNW